MGRDEDGWRLPILSIAVLLTVLLLFFPFDSGYSTITDPLGLALWKTWTTQTPGAQDYSYCIWVPFLVAGIIYLRRGELARAPVRGGNAGLPWILVGLLLFWIGSRAGKQYLGCGAIQMLLAGAIIWFWGAPFFRRLLFPWGLLTFAWPLPFVDSSIAFPLRLVVSYLAAQTLPLLGVPCLRSGTMLNSAANPATGAHFGDRFQIDVADPCSGLHSLLPLLLFSACYSYFFVPPGWRAWAVFLSAVPFAIIANVIRILLLVFGCLTWGSSFAMGTNENPSWYHEGCGYVAFILDLGFVYLLGLALNIAGNSSSRLPEPAPATDSALTVSAVSRWRSKTLFALAAVMAIISWNHSPPVLSPVAGVSTDLPDMVTVSTDHSDTFFGVDTAVSDVEHNILPKDTQFARKTYHDAQGRQILFSIVLSGLQQYNIHPPQVCLVAQGWSIIREENVPVHLASGRDLTVRNLTLQREALGPNNEHLVVTAYYMYWYVTDGLSTPSSWERNWWSSWDRILHNRDHRWAYVIAMAPITQSLRPDGLNAAQTRGMLTDFIGEIVPTFQKSEMAESGPPALPR